MDTARVRTYIVVAVALFGFAALRVITNSNPIYSLLEPITSRLSSVVSDFSLVDRDLETIDPSSLLNESLQIENEDLRRLNGLNNSRKTISAEVIRRNLLGFEKHVWIGRGSNSAVAAGQTVMHNNQLFGVVERVFANSAEIKTIIDPQFRSTVAIGDEQGVLIIDHGSILVDLVPDKALEGKRVETNGIDGMLSAGISVGRLGKIASDENDVFASYPLQLSYSPYSADLLQVVIDEEMSLQ